MLLAQADFLAATLVRVRVRLRILPRPGVYFVYQHTLYQVLIALLMYVHGCILQFIFQLDSIIGSLIFPTKYVQFMQIIQIPSGQGVQITQIKAPLSYTPFQDITDHADHTDQTDPAGNANPPVTMCRSCRSCRHPPGHDEQIAHIAQITLR